MDRRTFMQALGAALVFQASAAWPQRATSGRVMGILNAEPFGNPDHWAHFHPKLRELGWVEGTNLIVERRSANNQLDQLPNLADELVRLNVDIIIALGTQAPLTAKKATSAIPIVIWNAGDPIENGLVTSLARPGGNITGTSLISRELAGKRLQLLSEMLPRLSRVTVL
jgi:putative ABC transport system substrate-binding protein